VDGRGAGTTLLLRAEGMGQSSASETNSVSVLGISKPNISRSMFERTVLEATEDFAGAFRTLLLMRRDPGVVVPCPRWDRDPVGCSTSWTQSAGSGVSLGSSAAGRRVGMGEWGDGTLPEGECGSDLLAFEPL
jgi:hypothetical protein